MEDFVASARHRVGFWVAALAFLVNMGFSAVPTPIYVLYQQRDHLSNMTVTVVYAVFALGIIVSLFLVGHLSDRVGRRRVLVPALLINVLSATVFILVPSLPGLVVARIISGVSIGLTTATATSYLSELHAFAAPSGSRRSAVVAAAANLGGIGFGPLAAGALIQFAPWPLGLPYLVFGVAVTVLAIAVWVSPETVQPVKGRPPYRPQRITVPAAQRRLFLSATLAGMGSFSIYGIMNTLVPILLVRTLHYTSHLLAGALVFAAFAGGAIAQITQARIDNARLLWRSVPTVIAGLALLSYGMWTRDLVLFVGGGLLSGAGAGMLFKGALVIASSTAPEDARAEVLAGFFLGSYIGLSVPVVGLGIATNYFPVRDVLLFFVGVAALCITAAVRECTHAPAPEVESQHRAPSDR